MSDPRTIACFHMNQIGDLIFSLPALHNLRARYPEAHITSIVRPNCAGLLMLSRLVDRTIERTSGGLLPDWLRLGMKLRRERFDLMLLFSTSHAAWLTVQVSGSKTKVGFAHDIPRLGMHDRVPWFPPPSTENNLRLVEAIGCPAVKKDYVGLIRPGERELSAADDLLASVGISDGEPVAVISPGSSKGREIKRWTDEGFAQVADTLKPDLGLTPVIAGMPGDADGIVGLSKAARDITGRTSLPVLAGILSRSRLFVGIDSGVMHLAGAVGTPVVALFGPSDFQATGPQGENSRIVCADVPCRPCHRADCSRNHECMRGIDPRAVVSEAESLLRRPQA